MANKMTHEKIAAVLKELRDEHNFEPYDEPDRTPEQIAALDSAIAHFTAIEAATGEEAKEHAQFLEALDGDMETDEENAACRAGAAAIAAIAASEERIKLLEQTAAFFACCIKSGEPWSDECERHMKGVRQ